MRTRPIIPVLLWALLAASGRSMAAASAVETESQLKQIRERIERVSHELGASAAARDREGARLHDSELAVSGSQQALNRLTQQQRDTRAERDRIAAERATVERDLSAQREALGAQLRLAHRLDRTGPLQFLLSQPDPMRAGRMLNFYGYFGRARAGQIAAIRERVQRIDVLDVQLEAAEAHLIKLTEERQQQLATFEDQRSARATVLAALNRDAQDKKQMLARLKSQQAELETLLRDLTRALRDSPPPPQVSGPFASLRGKLTWPAAGSLLARFGQQRATGVKWEGILLATVRAAAVRAVAPGRVVYADWLPGLGLLTIIDHGNGYMSLYGHNDTLRSAAGNLVRAGDVIADSGDTGGSSRPVLYFEIRQSGRPVDPLPWFTSARPN